jgi:hypothetical protein
VWGGRVGALLVVAAGYIHVKRHRPLILDEILAGVGLVIWIAVEMVNERLFGGPPPDLMMIWSVRGALIAVMIIAYMVARSRYEVSTEEA